MVSGNARPRENRLSLAQRAPRQTQRGKMRLLNLVRPKKASRKPVMVARQKPPRRPSIKECLERDILRAEIDSYCREENCESVTCEIHRQFVHEYEVATGYPFVRVVRPSSLRGYFGPDGKQRRHLLHVLERITFEKAHVFLKDIPGNEFPIIRVELIH